MCKLITFSSVSIILLLILLSFFCTDPVKPDFTKPPIIDNNGTVGTFGSLNCDSLFGLFVTVSGTAPFTYQWYKNDSIVSTGNNDTLLFSSLSLTDSGSYFCIVANTAGSDTSLAYTVAPADTMPKPPDILDSGAVAVFGSVQLDSSFGMFIRANGTEPIVYTWYKNSTAIAAVSNDTLLFPALTLTDSGDYYCIAHNAWGADTSKIRTISFGNFAPQWLHDTLHLLAYENKPFTLNLSDSCSDLNNDVLGYFMKSQSTISGDTIIGSVYYVTPTYENEGVYLFTVGAQDHTDTAYCTVFLTVIDVNRPPHFRVYDSLPADQYIVDEGDTLKILFSVVDLDTDTVSAGLKATTLPGGLTSVQIADTTITWIAGINDSGIYNLTLFATDKIDSTFDTITIGVGYVNIPPRITMNGQSNGSMIQIKEATTFACSLHVSDVNSGDTVKFLPSANLPSGAQFSGVGSDKGLLAYTPGFNVSNATVNTVFSNITFYAQDNGIPAALDSFKFNITVLDSSAPPIPVLQSPANNAVAQPVSLTLRWNASAGAASYNLNVSTHSDFSDTILNQSTTDTIQAVSNLSDNTKYYWRVNANNAGGTSGWSDVWNFIVTNSNTAPIIASQPVSDTVVLGDSVRFSVTATGVPAPTYQWYKNGVLVTGATSPAFSIDSVTASDSGNYTVVVKNIVDSVTSNTAVLFFNVLPTIITQPITQTKWANDSVTFTIAATGSEPLSYQWRKDGVIIGGATAESYMYNNIKYPDDSGSVFSCLVTNRFGSVVASDTAVLKLNAVKAIAAGGNYSLFLMTNGTLFGCGNNTSGQIGDSTTDDRHYPVQIMTDVKAIASGSTHSLIVKNDGRLFACGYNGEGELGDQTTISRLYPVQIMSDVQTISAGKTHSLILKTNGTLYSCGSNYYGQLGDSTRIDRYSPVQISIGIQSISAGGSHSLMLKTDGTLYACGYNKFGQLGSGTTKNDSIPIEVMSGIKSMAAGNTHSLYLNTAGTLFASGYNAFGQLGNSTTINDSLPRQIMVDIQYVEAGEDHSIIVRVDGTLFTCGNNSYGQLGDSTTTERHYPIQVMTNVLSAVGGQNHTIILKTDGTIFACGYNYFGQLGDGTSIDRHYPIKITF